MFVRILILKIQWLRHNELEFCRRDKNNTFVIKVWSNSLSTTFFLIPPPPPINRFAQNNYLRLAFKIAVYAGFLGFLLGREEVVEWTRKVFQQNYGASLVAAVAAAATPEAGIDGVGALRWYRLCG